MEILLIEDDLRLRTEIQKHLEKQEHGVYCTSDARDGFETLQQVPFDIVISDIRLPGMTGTDLLREISAHLPSHPPVIVITGHGDKETAIKAIHFGVFEFLEKPFTPKTLDDAIARAAVEKKQDILNYRTFLTTTENKDLTARESEVACLAAEGLSNEEIALRLSLGSETIKSHLKNIFRKLGVSNRTSLSARLRRAS